MKTLIGFEEIEDKIITLRGQKVLSSVYKFMF